MDNDYDEADWQAGEVESPPTGVRLHGGASGKGGQHQCRLSEQISPSLCNRCAHLGLDKRGDHGTIHFLVVHGGPLPVVDRSRRGERHVERCGSSTFPPNTPVRERTLRQRTGPHLPTGQIISVDVEQRLQTTCWWCDGGGPPCSRTRQHCPGNT